MSENKTRRVGRKSLKAELKSLVESPDSRGLHQALETLDPRQAASPLIGFLCQGDPAVKHRAAEGIGILTARLARTEPESARVIVRRLLWQLNEESGGIGWGVPEALGEILARAPEKFAKDYASILVSYVASEENFLEHGPLRRGALWALTRLAETKPGLAEPAREALTDYLGSDDPAERGLAAHARGRLGNAEQKLNRLRNDGQAVSLWQGDRIRHTTVAELAGEARK